MLKQRILTGVVLILLSIFIIIYAPISVFVVLSSVFFLFAAWEWGALIGLRKKAGRIYLLFVYLVCGLLAYYLPLDIILIVSGIWWLIVSVFIFTFPRSSILWWSNIGVRAVIGLLSLVPCWLSINAIKSFVYGPEILIFLLCVIWATDSGAYFLGKYFGKHKLAYKVSPNKTIEGFFGGLIAAMIVAFIAFAVTPIPVQKIAWVFGVVIVVSLFCVVGDLFESMVKRKAGCKDTGSYLPGHGGLLDRIDSLLAAGPVFVLCSVLLSMLLAGEAFHG